ncbi:MAG: ferrochelatase [Halioglobus sp.]
MKYINTSNFDHARAPKIGVLISNLGTPEAPQPRSLRRYLKEFLSDPRVVEVPRLIWWFILNGVILNIRPRRSAKAYAKVWTPAGSPLMEHTRAQADALATHLSMQFGEQVIVDFAMRYGQPSVTRTIQGLIDRGVTRLLVLPLYPQYSGATTASTFDALADDFKRRRLLPEFRFVSHYHDYPPYIQALANKIKAHWETHGRAQKIIFSYHGVPQSYLDSGDPYHCECYKTTRLVAEQLGLEEAEYTTTFQSRFGAQEWLKPYTDKVLQALPGEGVKSVQILCPGFSADCLETLEEIDEENRGYFTEAGGERFEYIPCLNSDEQHIEALYSLVTDNIQGWVSTAVDTSQTSALAIAAGAKQ